MSETLLSVRDLSVEYRAQSGTVYAVDRVSFDIDAGQQLGVIGESGCGKTTLMRALVQVLPRNGRITGGEIWFKGRDLLQLTPGQMRDIRWQEIATIPQASMDSLDPVRRVGHQLEKLLKVRGGLSSKQARQRAGNLFELVGLDPERLSHYPHEFSGGMKQRAIIAMALSLNPSLLIADEPVTALDVIVQHQILEVLRQLQQELNLTVLLITHDISVVAQLCNEVAVMYAGRMVERAAAQKFFRAPSHPYSLGLQQAYPNLLQPRDTLISIEGYPPDLRQPPAGCRFARRCPLAIEQCRSDDPALREIATGHLAACLRSDEMETLRAPAAEPLFWQQTEAAREIGLGAKAKAKANGKQQPPPEEEAADDAIAADDILLDIRDVSKRFKIGGGLAGLVRGQREQTLYAVNDIAFTLRRGESLGLAGESGCGKTTTGKLLVKLLEPSHGNIVFDSAEISYLNRRAELAFRKRVQLMFQNPFEALNPRFTLYRSLAEPLIIHGWKDERARLERILETLERVNLQPPELFLDQYPHQLSGGQLQRVVLARALVLHPDFLVADEPVSMLDVSVRAGILNTTRRLAREMGLATVYISHDLSLLQYTCDRIAVMYLGYIVEIGPSQEVIANPKHPYTQSLIAAVPVPDPALQPPPLRIREGVPRPTEQARGCPFASRCPEAREACLDHFPPSVEIEPGHIALCHLYGKHADSPPLSDEQIAAAASAQY